jgi:phosphoribosylformimino-5-aminoimidazole carboxamide ribotide isomerase
MSFEPIPAIDVRDGRVVRLAQGDYAAQGARWLHLVDLDAARAGGYTLQPLVARLRRESGLMLQTGGGVRDEATLAELLALGVERVVLGTIAVREPERVARWIARHGAERIVLALDTRQDAEGRWRLPVSGWTDDGAAVLPDLLQAYAASGIRNVLCTDIARDGMLSGFNVDLYRELAAAWPTLRLQASGGVRDLGDVRAARTAGASAAILGRALLEGRFSVAEAMAC